ncbi:hypothetical protein VKT23_016538 [Stygiomarasmius scandens]|uniref:DUF6699 domain-containing protein n=1 Tax=Marasmiellus scandens TaxID=2682957 RepID=A0ABR1IXH1_9AGAR
MTNSTTRPCYWAYDRQNSQPISLIPYQNQYYPYVAPPSHSTPAPPATTRIVSRSPLAIRSSSWPPPTSSSTGTQLCPSQYSPAAQTPENHDGLYRTIPLPPQADPNVDVIPFLKAGSGLNMDLGLKLHHGHTQWPPIGRNMAERAATNPPIPSMTITHPSWKTTNWITVHRSSMPYVTVWDVLVTMIRALAYPDNSDSVTDRRTRLDLLPGRRLVGLTKSNDGVDLWIMEIA